MPLHPPPEAHADALPPPRESSAEAIDDDPLRQLFRRHANHFVGIHARQIRSRLKLRLFTEQQPGDSE